jgi:hypothetical protein
MSLEQAVGLFAFEGMTRDQIVQLVFKLDTNRDGFLSWPEYLLYANIPVIPVPKILSMSNEGEVTIVWNTEMSATVPDTTPRKKRRLKETYM